jgi:hypothetical protein
MQRTPTLRQLSLHTCLGEVKSPALTVRPVFQRDPGYCIITGQNQMGELHDGNDISKTDLHPRITSPAMQATLIGREVGNRTNYRASTGHPCSMDLPVPLSA